MTRDEILAMPAGQQLDQHVHEFVRVVAIKHKTSIRLGRDSFPPYSTSDAVALHALRALRAVTPHSTNIVIVATALLGFYVGTQDDVATLAQAETLALAICRAVLLSRL